MQARSPPDSSSRIQTAPKTGMGGARLVERGTAPKTGMGEQGWWRKGM